MAAQDPALGSEAIIAAGFASDIEVCWKTPSRSRYSFGRWSPVTLSETIPDARALRAGKPWMVWAPKRQRITAGAVRVEDGFLRVTGLGGADLGDHRCR